MSSFREPLYLFMLLDKYISETDVSDEEDDWFADIGFWQIWL